MEMKSGYIRGFFFTQALSHTFKRIFIGNLFFVRIKNEKKKTATFYRQVTTFRQLKKKNRERF